MSVGGGGGGYSGGGGGFSGGFAPPPMFGGGFGGGFGMPQFPQYGGGFGGGFGMPQQPQYGGGFGGGFGQPQQPQFGGGFGQSGPGNAYARPFPGLQPQPAPPPQQLTPPPGMELNPDYYDRFANGRIGTMDVRPSDNRFRPIQRSNPATGVMPSEPIPAPNDNFTVSTQALIPATRDGVSGYYTDGSMRNFVPNTPTGGGYPSRDQSNQTFQVMPAVMPETPTGGGYPSRDSFGTNLSPVIEPTGTGYMSGMGGGLMGMLGGGLGGLYGGYQAMPYGGYQPMGGYRMFPF